MSKKMFYEAPESEQLELRLEETILSNYQTTAEDADPEDVDEW